MAVGPGCVAGWAWGHNLVLVLVGVRMCRWFGLRGEYPDVVLVAEADIVMRLAGVDRARSVGLVAQDGA